MAKKSSPAAAAAKRRPKTQRRAKASPASPRGAGAATSGGADFADMAKMARAITPEKAFELYKSNAKLALDVINTAIENTSRLRKLQFEGEEQSRSMQKKAIRHAAEADNPQSLVAAGQTVTQEAVEKAMQYWGEMFSMIVEMQKRLFALMEDQMAGVPGAKEAKAVMAMMPDMRQAQNLVTAMQGVMASGAPAFSSMQKVMGDFARMAQQSMPGGRR
ncbi:MAG: TIGR01841 family phasin [Pseudomonadota bacterium]|nr:TIGR01841 family phasin [Pseudomonadota bacterium]